MDIARTAIFAHISQALLQTHEAYASLGRIEDFLLLENIPTISPGQSKEDTSNTESSSTKAMNGQSDPEKKKEEVFSFHHLKLN